MSGVTEMLDENTLKYPLQLKFYYGCFVHSILRINCIIIVLVYNPAVI